MQNAVILTVEEHAAIPLNAGAMIFKSLKDNGFRVVNASGDEFERVQTWLVGILASNSDLLTVPWKQSRLNPERE